MWEHKAGVRAQGVERGSSGLTVPIAEKDFTAPQPPRTLVVLGHFGVE